MYCCTNKCRYCNSKMVLIGTINTKYLVQCVKCGMVTDSFEIEYCDNFKHSSIVLNKNYSPKMKKVMEIKKRFYEF